MQQRLFEANLIDQLEPRHELLLLAAVLDWAGLDREFGTGYAPRFGRPAISTRLILGLLIVRQMRDLSDREVVALFMENPYVQAFCGCTRFQLQAPCDASTLTRWRKRHRAKIEAVLKESVQAALRSGALKVKDLDAVVADTTVQEKAVTPPTDGKLLYAMQKRLVREARARGIELKRTGLLRMRRLKARHARLRHRRQKREARATLARMRTEQRRLVRRITLDFARLDESLVALLHRSARLRAQTRGLVPSRERVYSVHAPEVECIGKGKLHKPWEFGVKVGLAVTARKTFALACDAYAGRPYDGATLAPTLAQAERVGGVKPVLAIADQGYKGEQHHRAGIGVLIAGARRVMGALKRMAQRRSSIEPAIGHLKNRLGMDRNGLKGALGDRCNAILSATVWNLLKLARHLGRRAAAMWRLLALWLTAQLVLARLRLENRLAAQHVAA